MRRRSISPDTIRKGYTGRQLIPYIEELIATCKEHSEFTNVQNLLTIHRSLRDGLGHCFKALVYNLLIFIFVVSIVHYNMVHYSIVHDSVIIDRYLALVFITIIVILGMSANFTFAYRLEKEKGGFYSEIEIFRISIITYFVIIHCFSVLYAVSLIQGNFHSITMFNRELLPSEIPYFSVITVTTLGYGDIFPTHVITQILASLEAIIGVIYITFTIVLFSRILIEMSQHSLRADELIRLITTESSRHIIKKATPQILDADEQGHYSQASLDDRKATLERDIQNICEGVLKERIIKLVRS